MNYRIDEVLQTEILVIGSGLAGVCAAIQAGRMGCSVMLIEMDAVLGGNSGPNLGIHPSGAHSFHPYASETGIIGEIEEDAAWLHAKIHTYGYHYNIAMQWDSLLKRKMEEAGVQVLRRNYGKTAITESNRIKSVIIEDLATFKTKCVDVSVAVIDASGDGQVAKEAGAEFRKGREAQSEFNERSAPSEADNITLGTSITALVRKASKPVKFVPPPGTPPYEIGYGFGKKELKDCLYAHSSWNPDDEFCFLWHTETGGQVDTIEDEHEIYEELRRQLYSAWNHIKNEAHVEEAKNWELCWVSPKAGKRESRRFIGDYILTQNDIENAVEFEDAVAYGGYAIDIHNPAGKNKTQVEIIFCSVPPLYNIPYRSLYSKDIDNLFLAGRLISVTHIALGTVRLIKTLATAGQAVGVAAALCKKYACSPREIYQKHLKELQQTLLKHDSTILTVKNDGSNDLARCAKVTATSEERFEVVEVTDFLSLDRTRGIQLWYWPKHFEAIELYLMNENDYEMTVPLSLSLFHSDKKWKESHVSKPFTYEEVTNRMEWGSDNTIGKFIPVAESSANVPPHFVGWVRFEFGVKLIAKDPKSDEDRYALTIPPTLGLSWGRNCVRCDFARRCWTKHPIELGYTIRYHSREPQPDEDLHTEILPSKSHGKPNGEYNTYYDSHLFKIYPQPTYGEAINVINGWNRRFCTNPVNMWISKRGEPLPQSLTLEWDKPQRFNSVHIIFDTLTRTYREMPFNCGQEVSPMCVKDYSLEVSSGEEWQKVAVVKDNYRRLRVHGFDTVVASKLRLTVEAINSSEWTARVYEIRVTA